MNHQGRILVVDQDPSDVGVLRALLRDAGYQVDLVGSGRSALLAVADAPPDLVLVDVDLPDMDGIAVCERVKARDPERDIPVIFLGTGIDEAQRAEAIERGGADFIGRPFDEREVLARVKRHVTVARVRRALQQSEAKFRAATESALDAIISADERGNILSWNPAAAEMLGHADHEVIGKPLGIIIPERFRAAHDAGLARVAGGGASRVIGRTVELAAVRKDGTEFPVELSLGTWVLDGKRYFTGILRDISQRREAEQKFRSVTESAIDAIVSSDHESRIVGWNHAAEVMFGWSEEQVKGQPVETIIPERFRTAHRHGMDRLTQTGDSRVIGRTVELAALHSDGHEFPIELSLSTWTVEGKRFYTGIIRDISRRKQAEERLRGYADELARQHQELQQKHEELQRSQQALAASFQQAQKLFSAMTDGLPGAVLNGKYRLVRKIAAGGFGVVYEARQLALDRKVAVKLLRPPTHEDEATLLARFRREGISACRVNHPNAVSILDLDITDGGFPYIVMEHLDGRTLGERIREEGPLPVAAACEIVAEVCSVIAATHRAGVIHRDIKPSNIFLCDPQERPRVKVLDFGVAKLMDEPGLSSVTRTGHFVGTPSYMAPESLQAGAAASDTADAYGLGVVLYEALTGRLPIPARETLVQTIQAHVNGDPDPILTLCPDLPPALADLVGDLLQRDPRRRPSASQVESRLRDLAASVDADAPARCPTERRGPDEETTAALRAVADVSPAAG